jgi:predicted Fe-S protein YdhL (DUF1289 family)
MHTTPWLALQQRWQQVQKTPESQACASPFMSVCVMKTDADECWGCLRTLDEVAHWSVYSPAEQCGVWQRIAQRVQQHFQQA